MSEFKLKSRAAICLLVSLVLIGIATAGTHSKAQLSETPLLAESGKWKSVPTPSPTPIPGPTTLSQKFIVTATDLRKAYDAAELKGERKENISIGEEQSLNVTAQTGLNQAVPLKLRVEFLSPLDQARQSGYEFGLVARDRTPADRKSHEDAVIKRIVQNSNRATFMVRLLPVPDPDLNLPIISFSLVDWNGNEISPTTAPTGSAGSSIDLIHTFLVQRVGQQLIFPLVDASGPRITNQMDTMNLVVRIDEQRQNLQYRLKP